MPEQPSTPWTCSSGRLTEHSPAQQTNRPADRATSALPNSRPPCGRVRQAAFAKRYPELSQGAQKMAEAFGRWLELDDDALSRSVRLQDLRCVKFRAGDELPWQRHDEPSTRFAVVVLLSDNDSGQDGGALVLHAGACESDADADVLIELRLVERIHRHRHKLFPLDVRSPTDFVALRRATRRRQMARATDPRARTDSAAGHEPRMARVRQDARAPYSRVRHERLISSHRICWRTRASHAARLDITFAC